ncbi:peptide chain release factor N(5)-glutamine methyltransferase [Alteromonas sp. ASW11-130]|uniref:peptide chain release factor N(5)-glutamine methyltransferase n=1 Tax=Alteromonas sp. ASW11-130 TaxID=3015775 RepID=UPI0022418E61|nr:peptide chain release factor N(5)-glutamine methyltransferase [Alteromonas sp. ASW11-130]MCW8090670.1 peptide chain release factor N(5)-glutamine methyltransferase [Alteromonas sp. ASW11-130]
MRIDQALAFAQAELAGTETPAIDSRALLCHCLKKPVSYLYTWPERELSEAQLSQFNTLVAKRKEGTPVAYLRGHQEFWSMDFSVSEATLIPRPETELLVEKVLELNQRADAAICDLGTGTGAIAIALASELPKAHITGVDRVPEAVELAKSNAALNHVKNVTFKQSDWFSAIPNCIFDIIVSNPPYVESASEYLLQGDVRFEPASALTSGKDGLDDIRNILSTAAHHLNNNGMLLIEHGYNQGPAVAKEFETHGFTDIITFYDVNTLDRVTTGRWYTC